MKIHKRNDIEIEKTSSRTEFSRYFVVENK